MSIAEKVSDGATPEEARRRAMLELGGMRNSFTPTPYNPDELANRKGIRIYRKMYLEDEQVKAALNAKKYAVLSTGYEIRKPELPDQETDKAVDEYTDFAEFNLNEMKGSFESKLLDIMRFSSHKIQQQRISLASWPRKLRVSLNLLLLKSISLNQKLLQMINVPLGVGLLRKLNLNGW